MSASGEATLAPAGPAALAMTSADVSLERRVSGLILAATPLLFVLFLAIAPSANPTFDDAKYVGVGRNLLAGDGPLTGFGVVFLKHSPLWPIIIVLPERLLGAHPIATGHLVNALSAAAAIVLVGYLGWRVRPAIGAIAAVLFASLPYVFDLARTAGIDLPSIVLTLAYLAFGLTVVRSGSLLRAALLGAIFAAAFLIKETVLPFAVVPFILGILWGVPWRSLAGTAAVTLGVAAVGTAPWFAMYAGYTGRVYRAELPAWTLLPATIAIAAVVILGLAADPIAERVHARGWDDAASRRIPARLRSRAVLGWAAVAAWFTILVVFFGRTRELLGASLFDPDQLAYAVANSIASVRLAFAFGLGSVLLVADLLRQPRRVDRASVDVLVAVVCGIPLILLVVGIGETPRHYVAELALIILTGTIGWSHGLVRLRERDPLTVGLVVALVILALLIVGSSAAGRLTPTLVAGGIGGAIAALVAFAVGLRWLRSHGRLALVGMLVAAVLFVFGLGTVGVRAVRMPHTADANEARATADTIAWLKATVPPGETVAFGQYLSMETSIDLPAGYRAIQVRQYLAVDDPTAPLGLRSAGGTPTDYVAVDVAPLKANQFDVFSASRLLSQLRSAGARYYVVPVSHRLTSAAVLGVLTPANGFTELPVRTYRGPDDTIDVHTYRVDLGALDIPADRMVISPAALERLVDRLERSPAAAAAPARNLVDRIVPPADGSETALLARLAALAGR